MKESIETIIKWGRDTFPDATLEGQIHKYAEETCEFMNADEDNDLAELADMVIVSAGIIRFNRQIGRIFLQNTYIIAAEYDKDMTELWDSVDKKMEKNRKRVWAKTQEGAYHHTNKE